MEVITVTADNYKEFPPVCFCKADTEGFVQKESWLKKRFKEGLKIKLLKEGKKTHGFIEYIPGEFAWRAVDAKGYMFIHCMWMFPNKVKGKGYGSKLIQEVLKEGKPVAVVTSDGSFMADKSIFLKNGFKIIEESGKHQLLVTKGSSPAFTNTSPKKYKELTIVYSKQCPWVNRFISELTHPVKLIELKTAKQAQKAPSIYSVMTIIKDGEILADHYISQTRFKNILKKL